jgi:glycosyltransferase involved in cell wall biosynthesis
MRKKKILVVTESHKLASGFGVYGIEILKRLHKTGKYELAELACYCSPTSVDQQSDWLTYGVAPMEGEEGYAKEHTAQPQVQWGIVRFERACLDFKPDIVITYRDPWMDAYIADSPFLPFFHWVWMPTIDSEPQKLEWLYQLFNRCDGLMAYSEFGIRALDKQTQGRLKPVGCASPAMEEDIFGLIPNKKNHKRSFGLDPDSFIVGTVMRNQKRKMFPELMQSFKDFLDQAPPEIAEKSFLYLHTSYPEKMGWEITSLVHEYGLGSKVLCTYKCRGCGKFFPSHFRDAITICRFCKHQSAVMPGVSTGVSREELMQIYNLMDCYVQYAICEGFGMPQVEAAACGVPVVAIDYSAMEDIVKQVKGVPIAPSLAREMETNANRSGPNNKELTKALLLLACQDKDKAKRHRLETRKGCLDRYTWDNAAKAWENYIDNVEGKGLEGQWNSPPTMAVPPDEPPKNMTHHQFAEWVCTRLIQDQYSAFNYRMLLISRSLNFGADFGSGQLKSCTQKSVFEEHLPLAHRRYLFDALRTGQAQEHPHKFIEEAHRRHKK